MEVLQSLKAPNDLMQWRWISRREILRMPSMTTPYESIYSLFPVDMDLKERMLKYSVKINNNWFDINIKAEFYNAIVNEQEISGDAYRRRKQLGEEEDLEESTWYFQKIIKKDSH